MDPVTGAIVEEAPVPIPGTIPGRAGLGAYDRETARLAHAAASSADDGVDELVDRQSKLLSMMGLRASGSGLSAAGEDSGDESWAEDEKPRERTKVEHSYSHADLKKLNVNCDAVPAGVDMSMFEEADRRKIEKEKAEAAEKKKREKAEKDAAEKERKEKAKAERAEREKDEKERKEKAKAERAEREKAEKERKESARERVARSKSTDQLDDAPSLGGALGLGFLGINSSSNSLASQEEVAKKDDAKEGEKKGMTVRELAAALMAELRGLEDRVEVLGEEEGPMVALKLSAALEAVRQEPFKSI